MSELIETDLIDESFTLDDEIQMLEDDVKEVKKERKKSRENVILSIPCTNPHSQPGSLN